MLFLVSVNLVIKTLTSLSVLYIDDVNLRNKMAVMMCFNVSYSYRYFNLES